MPDQRKPWADDVQHRYNTDPTFRHAVDALHAMIRGAKLSPQEVREAAMLAAIHYEIHRPQRWVMREGEMPRRMTDTEYEALRRGLVQPGIDALNTMRMADTQQPGWRGPDGPPSGGYNGPG